MGAPLTIGSRSRSQSISSSAPIYCARSSKGFGDFDLLTSYLYRPVKYNFPLMEEKSEFSKSDARVAVLEPLHHSDTFVASLQSPEGDTVEDPFADLEAQSRESVEEPATLPRHLRFGSEWRNLRRSTGRLVMTVAGLILAWILCITVVTTLRTRGLGQSP